MLELVSGTITSPGKGEIQVENHYCGVNFVDIYQRSGLYGLDMPATMGNEASGVISDIGQGVEGVSVGDRVAYCTAGTGCMVSMRNIPAAKAIALPDSMDLALAGGCMLRGLTAEYLARRTWPVTAGTAALVTAAAGGVGRILCQWLSRLGAQVIGVVGSDSKAKAAKGHGCDEVLIGYGDVGSRARALAEGGVDIAYDSVGAATWPSILDAIAPRGCLVSYGNASGPVPDFAPLELSSKGSLFLTRPTLSHYAASQKELSSSAGAFFDEINRGLILPQTTVLPLAEAKRAHEILASRKEESLLVLDPRDG